MKLGHPLKGQPHQKSDPYPNRTAFVIYNLLLCSSRDFKKYFFNCCYFLFMLIFSNFAGAVIKGFPKTARPHMKGFQAAKVNNFSRIFYIQLTAACRNLFMWILMSLETFHDITSSFRNSFLRYSGVTVVIFGVNIRACKRIGYSTINKVGELFLFLFTPISLDAIPFQRLWKVGINCSWYSEGSSKWFGRAWDPVIFFVILKRTILLGPYLEDKLFSIH